MQSEDHNLEIFRIFFIIKGIVTLAFALFPLFYIFFGAFLFGNSEMHEDDSHIAGVIIITIGIVVFLLLLVMGILTLLTAKYLGEKKHYDFIFVMAIINCLTGILGIILGIFTILELNKPHIKRLFGKPA